MHKPILIVAEALDDAAVSRGQPIAGARYGLLRSLLDQAGIAFADCAITTVFQQHVRDIRELCAVRNDKANYIPDYRPIEPGRYIHARYAEDITQLYRMLDYTKPNVTICLGPAGLWALAKKAGLKKFRGSPLYDHTNRWKLLPTWSPEQIQRQWSLRPIAISDLAKAKDQSTSPTFTRPRREIWIEPSIADIRHFYEAYIIPAESVSCDIETAAGTITEVGYAPSPDRAIVIPFYSRRQPDGNYWRTAAEEREAWSIIAEINRTKPLFGQNFQYDMQYFWRAMGIPCPGFCDDTMLLHHSLQPEMEKGLGFLGSIYTREAGWKFMRHDNAEHYKQGED